MVNLFRQTRTYARLPGAVPLVDIGKERLLRRKICRFVGRSEREFEELPKFGPVYSAEEAPIFKGYKEEAWKHVLEKTGGDKLKTTENKLETTENYLSAIREVEKEAMDCYLDVRMVESVTEFRWVMLKDGCFLLQLVILILGGSFPLNYPEDHVIFGRSNRKDMKRWLKSMFYVGNQIPLVILWKLMEQPFFQDLLVETEWKEPSNPLNRVLYELLLVPYIRKQNSSWQITFPTTLQGPIHSRNSQLPVERPSDLLHGLHSFVIGTRNKNPTEHKGEDIDLELGDVEDAVDDKEFLSATKLFQAGIRFKKVKGMGCRGIYFKTYISSSVVFMPTLTVDGNTELMFQYLKSYEMTQSNRRKREVCAYLKFMSDLIQTTEDVKLLASQGIIKGDHVYRENLPRILSSLAHGESSKNLWPIRLQINEYSQPAWLKYKGILSIALFLTLLQTIFTILSYIRDVNKS